MSDDFDTGATRKPRAAPLSTPANPLIRFSADDPLFTASSEKMLRGGRKHARKWSDLPREEREDYVAAQIRDFAAEVNSAYLEQRLYGTKHRLDQDTTLAILSLAEWHEYDLALSRWRMDPDNDAAFQISEVSPDNMPPEAKRRMDAAPKRPKQPKAFPPRGCPKFPTIDSPRQWDELVAEFFEARRRPTGPQGE